MKKLLLVLFIMLGSLGASAQLIKGEKSLGVKLGYVSENHSAVGNLAFQYNMSSRLRIAPEIGCAFRNQDKDALLIDVNLHAPFSLAESNRVLLYPLAGLSFNSWTGHHKSLIDDADVSSHTNRFGVNLGAGFDLRCSESLRLSIEAKYTLIKSYSAAYITAGISYLF